MSVQDNLAIGRAWMRAFNAHDIDALVALYADHATHTSPKVRTEHPDTGGLLRGKTALSKWWRESDSRLPDLRYEEKAMTANEERVFVEYIRHCPGEAQRPVAEVFDVRGGRIVASRVYHG